MENKEKDLGSILEKGLKIRVAYTKNSPIYKKTIEEIKKKIEENFKEEIILKIKDREILQNDFVLYKKDKKEDNIFFPLYRDGLREISIDPNINEEELQKFIEVLNYDILKTKDEVDTVGFLWKQDLSYISYKAIDGIGEGEKEGEKGDEFSKAIDELMKSLKEKPSPYPLKNGKYKMVMDKDIKIDKLYVENKETEKISFEENPLIFGLEEKEIEEIKERVLTVEREEYEIVFKFIKILIYCTKNEKLKEKEDLYFYIESILNGFLKEKDFLNFFWLLKNLEDLKEKGPFESYISLLNINILKNIINDEDKNEYFQYLLHILFIYLPELLLEFIEFLPNKDKKIMESSLQLEIKNNLEILKEYLEEEKKALFILNIAPVDSLFIYFDKIKSFLNSSSEELKEKAFNILLPYAEYLGYEKFLIFLKDKNQTLRMKVLKAIEDKNLKEFSKEFLNFLIPENWNKLPIIEKKLHLKIILKNCKEDEKIVINNLLPKKKLFLTKNEKEKAREVANILSQIPEGKIFLKNNEKYWKKYLREK